MLKDFLLKNNIKAVLVVLVVLLVLYYYYGTLPSRETFFVAYNVTNVPINKQETLDESDVFYLNTALNKYNTSGFPNTYDYMKYTGTKKDKLPLPLSNEVQDLISEKVITTLRIINKGDRLEIRRIKSETKSEAFYDLYWKMIDNNIHCVFKMDIMNKDKGWSRTFKIYLVVKTAGKRQGTLPMANRLVRQGTLPMANRLVRQGTLPMANRLVRQDTLSIIIKTISLEEFSYLSFEDINQNDEGSNYYKIENTLRLMDPYLTSGTEMKITDSMKEKFNNALKKKYLT